MSLTYSVLEQPEWPDASTIITIVCGSWTLRHYRNGNLTFNSWAGMLKGSKHRKDSSRIFTHPELWDQESLS